MSINALQMSVSSLPLEWVVFVSVSVPAILLDIYLSKGKDPTMRIAILQTLFYVSLALGFGGFVWWYNGADDGATFLTGWIVEYSLSLDNLFVIALIMTALAIPPNTQRTLLYLGIAGAVLLRGTAITAGTVAIQAFWPILPALGALLIYLGAKVALTDEDEDEEPLMLRLVRKWGFSPFVAAFVAIEVSDLIFAVDSLPAIFSISQDTFVVFTSNMFAILGLRSLFFCLQTLKDKFSLLQYGIGLVLSFIGVKIILAYSGHIGSVVGLDWLQDIEIPTTWALGVTVVILSTFVVASLVIASEEDENAETV